MIKNKPTSMSFQFRVPRYEIAGFVLAGLLANNAMAGTLTTILNTIQNAPENSWVQMNTNHFSDAYVPADLRADPYSSYSNPATIILSWSSFAWDPNRGDLLLFGGGHANYAGNEVYRWRGSTQKWEIAALPSALDSNLIPVGGALHAPQSSHTYDNQLFLPVADRFVTLGGAAFGSGYPFQKLDVNGSTSRTGPYFFDPSKANPNLLGGPSGTGVNPSTPGGNMWSNRDIYTDNYGNATNFAVYPPGSANGTTDYAYQNGKEVIYLTGPDSGGSESRLARLTIADINNPSKDTWEYLGGNYSGTGGQGAGAYDPVHNIYIKTYGTETPYHEFVFWNLSTPGLGNNDIYVTLAYNPSSFNDALGQYGFEYDHLRNHFLLWGGGGTVFQLDVGNLDGSNWSVTEVNTDTATPLPNASIHDGVMGKWHYARNLDVFVALDGGPDGSLGNVWFFKPAGWVLPGDLNADGKVNTSDYAVFRTTLGKKNGAAGFISLADYDYDGVVTNLDYKYWLTYYNNR